MIQYRPFLNPDRPALAEIWRAQAPIRGRAQPLTTALLEELVLSKPYFTREGLIVALDGARPIGFVHAAFGPNADRSACDPSVGVIAMLAVVPHERRGEVTCELMSAAQAYLRKAGAKTVLVGGAPPNDPYYLGLYGGAQSAGVLDGDTDWTAPLVAEGYRPTQEWTLWRRTLDDYNPPFDRKLIYLARDYELAAVNDPATENWWEACLWGHLFRTRYDLVSRSKGTRTASAFLWDLQPLAKTWGEHAAGILKVVDTPELRSQGHTALLISEILQTLVQEQVGVVEAVLPAEDRDLAPILESLTFEAYEHGRVYQLAGDASPPK